MGHRSSSTRTGLDFATVRYKCVAETKRPWLLGFRSEVWYRGVRYYTSAPNKKTGGSDKTEPLEFDELNHCKNHGTFSDLTPFSLPLT